MANYEATRYDINGSNLTGIEGINTGIVVPWSDSVIPSGFLECNGASVSTATYAALFAVVGYTYGGSGGSFNVPDLQDKTVLSKSNNKALAYTGGANTVASTGNIAGSAANATLTTCEIPSHTHVFDGTGAQSGSARGGSGAAGPPGTSGTSGGGGSHSHNSSASFSGDANSVLQPYLTLIYIIKT